MLKVKFLLTVALCSFSFVSPSAASLSDGSIMDNCNMHSDPDKKDKDDAVASLDVIFNVPNAEPKEYEGSNSIDGG